MNDALYFNGFIIQGLQDSIYNQNINEYQGVGRYLNWPLFYRSDTKSKKITKVISKKYLDYLEVSVIGNYKVAMEYFCICEKLKIETRVIGIESRINHICEIDKKIESKFLGFDYITGYYNYSILADELLLREPILEFNQFEKILNSNELFETIEDIDNYINARMKIIAEGNNYNLDVDEGIIVRVSVVNKL